MKSVLRIIASIALLNVAYRLNDIYFEKLHVAVKAPMREGEIRDGSSENSTLDDPREVAKTPESQVKQAEAAIYKHAANFCLLGSGVFLLLAFAEPVLRAVARRLLPPQQEPPCESSASSSP